MSTSRWCAATLGCRGPLYPPSLLQVFAQAYDNPIPGYNTKTVGNLRLFEALAEHEFQLDYFNEGDFAKVRRRSGYRSEVLVRLQTRHVAGLEQFHRSHCFK